MKSIASLLPRLLATVFAAATISAPALGAEAQAPAKPDLAR